MKLDKSQLLNYAAIIGFIMSLAKINIGSEEITEGLSAILVLVGLGNTLYKRHKEGNLRLGIFKRDNA